MIAHSFRHMMVAGFLFPAAVHAATAPRVVSLDSCADQYVLALADEAQILALSPNATGPFSYFRKNATDYPAHDGSAESVLAFAPDIAVRTGVGDHALSAMLQRVNVDLLATGLPDTLAGMKADLRAFGAALGQTQRAEALIADMEQRLQGYEEQNVGPHPRAIYLSPGGSTTGADTFMGEVIKLSGLRNLMSEKGLDGWGQVDIEHLVIDPPDVIVGSFFDARTGMADAWRLADHPAMKRVMGAGVFISVPSKYLACPAWMMLDGVDYIRRELEVAYEDQ